jgi:hypothetical protein
MTWAQLKEMADNGAAIANHSVRHPHFVRRPPDVDYGDWRSQARREIEQAEARILSNTGQRHKVLAFPYGEFDDSLLALLDDLGYLGMSQASGAVRRGEGLAMPRFPMGGSYGSPGDFALKLRALPMPIADFRLQAGDGGQLTPGLIAADVARPVLEIELENPGLHAGLQCYASGQTAAVSKIDSGKAIKFQADKPLPAGRSRYNCTLRDSASGRFYWFSVPFLRPHADGSFPPEP